MSWPPFECKKCHRMWNTYPGAINYCNHMDEILFEYDYAISTETKQNPLNN